MISRLDCLSAVLRVLEERTDDPAESLITLGQALVDIGVILKGKSLVDSRAIIEAVMKLA